MDLSCICRLCEHCEHVRIAALCSEKLFPNLEATLKGVFNRELKNLRKASARFHRTLSISCRAVCAREKCSPCGIPDIRGLSCSYSCQNIDDAKGALGVTLQVIAEPELAIVL